MATRPRPDPSHIRHPLAALRRAALLATVLTAAALAAPVAAAAPAAAAGPPASIAGTVFDDVNGDGSPAATGGQPADPGQPGAVVSLTLAGGGAAVTTSGAGVAPVTTPASGAWSFSNLPAGSYDVDVAPPNGYALTTPATVPVTVAAGASDTGTETGVQERDGTLVLRLVDDRDGSGAVDTADTALAGASVEVLGPQSFDETIAAAGGAAPAFDANGSATLTGLVAGTYNLTVAGAPRADVQDVATTSVAVVGGTSAEADNAYYSPGTLAGTVFSDTNANGALDPGEAGLAGRAVTATLDGRTFTGTSASGGAWSITGLPPGEFSVTSTPPRGSVVTTAATTGTLQEGSSVSGLDLGQREQDATLQGVVFSDDNGDGVQQPDEAGLSGLTVTASNGVDPAYTTRTSPSGAWTLAALPGGAYTVSVATPAGSSLTTTGATGADPATVTVSPGATAPALSVGFRGPDAAPVFTSTTNNTSQSVDSGSGLQAVTATDANSDPLSFAVTGGSLPPGVSLATTGQFTGTTSDTTAVSESYSATITVTDGHGGSATTTLKVIVVPASAAAPTARPDTVDTTPGTPVSVPVLANDSDSAGSPLTIASYSQGSRGAAVSCSTTSCEFTPAASVGSGTETFTYSVANGRGGSATATVTVTYDNVKPAFTDAPANTRQTVAEGSPPTAVVAVDPNGDTVTYALVSGQLPPGVSLASTGAFTGGPTGAGQFTAVITADDGKPGTPAQTSLTVTVPTPVADHPPVANPDSYPAAGAPPLLSGGSATIDVLANDTDVDGDPLSVVAFDDPTRGGRVSLNADGSLRYAANPGFVGVDTFAYTVSDGRGGSDVGQVAVTVSAPPDQPPAFTAAPANTAQTVASGGALLPVTATDADPGTTLTYSLQPSSKPLPTGVTLLGDGTFTGAPVNGSATSQASTVTIVVSDGQLIATTTLTITVLPAPRVDAPPVAVDDSATTPYGQAVTVPVLANDSDPDSGAALAISAFDATSAHGGAVTCANASATSAAGCTYTPAPGFSGDDTFGYSVSDGQLAATAVVDVTVELAPPGVVRAVDDSATTATGVSVAIPVTANDTDSLLLPLAATAADQPQHGAATCQGSICTYTPQTGFTGDDTFSYDVSDGRGGSAEAVVRVAVTATAAVPTVVAVADTARTANGTPVSVPVTLNDTDSAGLALVAVPASTPAHGRVSCTGGTCNYTPDAGFSGTDTFTYSVADGAGGSAIGTVSISVGVPLLPPKLATPTTLVGGPVTSFIPLGSRPDIPLGGRLVSRTGALPPGITLLGDGHFAGAATRAGRYRFTAVVAVEGVHESRVVTVIVAAGSGASVATPALANPSTARAPTTSGLAFTGVAGAQGLLLAGSCLVLAGWLLVGAAASRPRRRSPAAP